MSQLLLATREIKLEKRENEYGSIQSAFDSLSSENQAIQAAFDTWREQSISLVSQIIQFIDVQYEDENLNVSAIADVFDKSPKTISRHFREATSTGILDYINEVRIRQAKKIAVTTAKEELTLEELSRQVGYSSVRTFRRAFHKIEGTAPSKFFKEL